MDGAGNLYVADALNEVVREVSAAGILSTVAGTPLGTGYSGDGGPANLARLNHPSAVTVDRVGNIYIADTGNNVIRKVDHAGVITTIVGGHAIPGAQGLGDGGPATEAILREPTDLALDGSGNLYIADRLNNLVRRVDAKSGVITSVAGGGNRAGSDGYGDGERATDAELEFPQGIALDASGNLYIADSGHNAIRFVAANSTIIMMIAGNGSSGYSGDGGVATTAELSAPSAIRVDAAGNVYIGDTGNDVIRLRSSSGVITTIAAGLASPSGVTIDAQGDLYITDTGHDVVWKVLFEIAKTFTTTDTSGISGGSVIVAANSPSPSRSLTDANSSNTAMVSSPVQSLVHALNLASGNQNVVQTMTLSNRGHTDVPIGGVWLVGGAWPITTTCTTILRARSTCTVSVTFPPVVTSYPASLLFSIAGARALVVPLTGTAVPITRSVPLRDANFAVWRPVNGTWFINSGGTAAVQQWGLPGDVPVPGDYDGDGVIDFAVWRPADGNWFVLSPDSLSSYPRPTLLQQWGLPGDVPVPGDYDGDGVTDFAVWRPANGNWFVLSPDSLSSYPRPTLQQQWGLPGDIPVPADYDGDGKTDFAVWRPVNGTWFIKPSNGTPAIVQQWGLPGDVPVPADYDGDGRIDFAVWRPSNGTWFIIPSSNPIPIVQQWGLRGDVPIAKDFNGDGKAELGIWRPSNGCWFVLSLDSRDTYPAPTILQQWGLRGDVPM